MSKIELQAEKREILGKKVKILREQKVTPVHLFGHGQESLALQTSTGTLEHVLARAGETRLITLTVGEEKKTRPVLVREVQRNSLNGELIHVDFYEVRMGQKVQVEVPIVIIGEAPALKIKGTSLVHELNTLTVECLPDNIPNKIEVNIASLEVPGNAIHVKDVKVEAGIMVLNNPEQALVVVTAPRVERVEVKEEVKEAPETAAAEETKATEEKAKPAAEKAKGE
jgi:large subunit ribosomal protein L25